MSFTIKNNLAQGLETYFNTIGIGKYKGADEKAKKQVSLQLLNWTVNGSSNEPTVPPIRDGILRASASVFVGGDLIGDTKTFNYKGTPNLQYTASNDTITVGFNTVYAAVMHESTWTPGGQVRSLAARNNPNILGNVGNKFIEKHLKADGEALFGMYCDIVKVTMG